MSSTGGEPVGAEPGTVSRESEAPLLPATTTGKPPSTADAGKDESMENGGKSRKRDFFRFGKKVEEDKKNKSKAPGIPRPSATPLGAAGGLRPVSPLTSAESLRSPSSPGRAHPYAAPASPRQNLRSASPRIHSPASSMIFERNVQEDVAPPQASPQIPSHIITENHIPPALDATSEAITDSRLNPDAVEIVTHGSHQPAAVTITGGAHDQAMSSSAHDDFPPYLSRQDTDNASNYASLESADVRRLSFISFADVVHAEQEMGDQRRDSHITSHPALVPPRSPSPMRSPVSSAAMGTSPPTSISPSMHGIEASPNRGMRGTGSPLPGQASPLGGELNIETMRQALRKTGSGDLSGFRSAPMSAIGNDEGTLERTFR